MIPFTRNKINSHGEILYKKYEKSVNKVINDIDNIYDFSNIVNVFSMEKIESSDNDISIFYLIKEYENFIKANDFHDLTCPCCKNNNCLNFHKTYERNIIFNINGYFIDASITLAILKCDYCLKNNKIQKYHTLFPIFISPYHIHSINTIIITLYNARINHEKISKIIEEKKISHQLFYYWLNGLYKYIPSSNTILGLSFDENEILNSIYLDIYNFLSRFYKTYFHPFFLFKSTCVPLAITI